MHNVKSEVMDQISDAGRNDDRLIGRDTPQGPAVEMIEMRMGHQNRVDRRKVIDMQTRALKSLDHAQPHRPIRINEDVHPLSWIRNDACPIQVIQISPGFTFGKSGLARGPTSFGKKRGNQNFSEKVALVPVESRFESDATAHGRFFALRSPRQLG